MNMKEKLDLPPELAHLIEKRDQEDRRGAKNQTPIAESPSTTDAPSAPTEHGERRSGADRRRG